MGEVKTINPFSMDNIDINELSKQQERIMMTDDVVIALNGHLQHTRFLEEGKDLSDSRTTTSSWYGRTS